MSPFRERAGEPGGDRSVRSPYPVIGGSHRNRRPRAETAPGTPHAPPGTAPDGPRRAWKGRLDATTARVTVRLEIDPEGLASPPGDGPGALGRLKGDLRRFTPFVEARGGRAGDRPGRRRPARP